MVNIKEFIDGFTDCYLWSSEGWLLHREIKINNYNLNKICDILKSEYKKRDKEKHRIYKKDIIKTLTELMQGYCDMLTPYITYENEKFYYYDKKIELLMF